MFEEWYDAEDDREAGVVEFLADATVAFDASALLELYRSDAAERAQILDVISLLGDRLFVPYHAALEYQRGRKGAIDDQRKRIETTVSDFTTAQTKAASKFSDKAVGRRVRAAWDTARIEIETLAAKLHDEYALTANSDDVRDALDALLTSKRVGKEPTHKQARKRSSEFEARARMCIPPGYLDVGKGAPLMYGDYFIWCELLDKARKSKQSLLLVTNDEKPDWSNQDTTPRRELVQEMRSVADVAYHHINLKTFLRLAQAHLSASIDNETIDNVRDHSQISTEGIQEIIDNAGGYNLWSQLQHNNPGLLAGVLANTQHDNPGLFAKALGLSNFDVWNEMQHNNPGLLAGVFANTQHENPGLFAKALGLSNFNVWDEMQRRAPQSGDSELESASDAPSEVDETQSDDSSDDSERDV